MAVDYENKAEDRAGRIIPSLRTLEERAQAFMPSSQGQMGPISERINLHNVEEAFQYQPWDPLQQDAGAQVRDALVNAAKVILRTVPDCPTRTRALNDLVDARMKANAAITFRGRF